MRFLLLVSITLFALACDSSTEAPEAVQEQAPQAITDTAAWVIQNAIERHGSNRLDSSTVAFVFRDRAYTAVRNKGQFTYKRSYTSKEGEKIDDEMTSSSFVRLLNGEEEELTDKRSDALANSLNSVMYFAFLPYFLTDKAVNLNYQGLSTDFGKPYHEVLVTFAEEGGGKDFEDNYVYWFDAEDFSLDYLAYNFLVNGGGARFREAYNPRTVNGVLFQDYINYKPKSDSRDVLSFDSLFQAAGLDTLSRIELENIVVQ